MEFFQDLDPVLRTLWFVALPASLVFIVQSIMTFTGTDASEGIHADFDSNFDGADAPFQLFSLRNLINFLLGFSWTGISFFDSIKNIYGLMAVSLLVGVGFVAMFFIIMKKMQKLAENNSFKITESLNKTGEVYLTIPENKSGIGKIQVSVKGSIREINAITLNDKILTGSPIRIMKIEGEDLVIVEKI